MVGIEQIFRLIHAAQKEFRLNNGEYHPSANGCADSIAALDIDVDLTSAPPWGGFWYEPVACNAFDTTEGKLVLATWRAGGSEDTMIFFSYYDDGTITCTSAYDTCHYYDFPER